jgi:membrane associated rhomboid family serine protease
LRGRFTWGIIAITVAVFLLDAVFGGKLLVLGAKSPGLWSGEYYRLITATFLHGGFIHLLLNMYALYIFGNLVEQLAGGWRFLAIYLFAGAAGYVASLMAQPLALAVGASASIFGLMGYTLHYRLRRLPRQFMPIDTAFLQILGINLLLGLLVPRIDQSAHLGGLLGGMLMGSIVGIPSVRGKPQRYWLEQVLAILLSFVLIMPALFPVSVANIIQPVWPAAANWIDARYGQYSSPLWAHGISLVWSYKDENEWSPAPLQELYPRNNRPVDLAIYWRWERGLNATRPVPYRIIWRVQEEGQLPQEHVQTGVGIHPDPNPSLLYYRGKVTAQSGQWQVQVEVDGRFVYQRKLAVLANSEGAN